MISICVLNYGEPILTRECLKSILNQNFIYAYPKRYEILVLDNYSTLQNQSLVYDLCEEVKRMGVNIRMKDLDNRYRFITGLNGAFRHAASENVLFMENDVFLNNQCLWRLYTYFKTSKKEIVSPTMYSPTGKVERYGSRWLWPGFGINQKKPSKQSDLITPSCFLMRKDDFYEIGEFDIDLAPAYYEDVDYSLRARKAGYSFRVIASAHATHKHNSTFGSVYRKATISSFCRNNRRKVIAKHYKGIDLYTRLTAIKVLDFIHGLHPSNNGKIGYRSN